MEIRVKRVYDKPEKSDGFRILIDRLWARGLTKAQAKVDLWLKDIAPTTELRKWFNHDPRKWPEFQKRYRAELRANKGLTTLLKAQIRRGPVTLVYGAKDTQHNDAVALKSYFEKIKI